MPPRIPNPEIKLPKLRRPKRNDGTAKAAEPTTPEVASALADAPEALVESSEGSETTGRRKRGFGVPKLSAPKLSAPKLTAPKLSRRNLRASKSEGAGSGEAAPDAVTTDADAAEAAATSEFAAAAGSVSPDGASPATATPPPPKPGRRSLGGPNLSLPKLALPKLGGGKKSAAPKGAKSFRRSKSERDVVGLDIEPGYVVAVQATANGSVKVAKAVGAPLDLDVVRDGEVLDPAALGHVLGELFRTSGMGRTVRVGLANQRTVLRTLDLPPIDDRKQLEAAVQFQAVEEVPMPLNNAVLDFQPLGLVDTPDGQRQRVVLVAAQRDMVERLLEALRIAGLRPVGVDLSAFALIRSLYERGGERGPNLVYLGVGGLTNMAVADGVTCKFTRVLGGGLEAMAEALASRREIPVTKARELLFSVGLGDTTADATALTATPPPPPASHEAYEYPPPSEAHEGYEYPAEPEGHEAYEYPAEPEGHEAYEYPAEPEGHEAYEYPAEPEGHEAYEYPAEPEGHEAYEYPAEPAPYGEPAADYEHEYPQGDSAPPHEAADPHAAGPEAYAAGEEAYPAAGDPYTAGEEPHPVAGDPYADGEEGYPAAGDAYASDEVHPAAGDPYAAGDAAYPASDAHPASEEGYADAGDDYGQADDPYAASSGAEAEPTAAEADDEVRFHTYGADAGDEPADAGTDAGAGDPASHDAPADDQYVTGGVYAAPAEGDSHEAATREQPAYEDYEEPAPFTDDYVLEEAAPLPPPPPLAAATAPPRSWEPDQDDDVHSVLADGVREIAGEVRNSLDFQRVQGGGEPVQGIVLSGPVLDVPGFAEALERELGLPVYRGEVHADPGAMSGAVTSSRLAVAAGLAVEEIAP